MRRLLIVPVIAFALAFTPVALSGASAEEAACDGANGGVDHALDQASAPGRAGDHVPAGQEDFVVSTVNDSNPQVPAGGCP